MLTTHRTGLLLVASLAVAPCLAVAQTVSSKTGLVVSTSGLASDAGAAILRAGGNAVDAAIATAFALAVTYPGAGNIGGGGFMVIRLANGTATTIDYRERAPLKSTPTMYLGDDGQIVRKLTNEGYLAPGVPGTVRGNIRASVLEEYQAAVPCPVGRTGPCFIMRTDRVTRTADLRVNPVR